MAEKKDPYPINRMSRMPMPGFVKSKEEIQRIERWLDAKRKRKKTATPRK